MKTFNFLNQAFDLSTLLDVCVSLLPALSESDQQKLTSAMEPFETTTVVTSWSVEDVDGENLHSMTNEEKIATLQLFFKRHECTDADWSKLGRCSDAIIGDRQTGLLAIYSQEKMDIQTEGGWDGCTGPYWNGVDDWVPLAEAKRYTQEELASVNIDLSKLDENVSDAEWREVPAQSE